MTRRFVILIDGDATAEERDAVTQHFMNSELYGFWHHFHFSWLVTTSDETVTASDLRDEIKDKLTDTSIVVIRIDGAITWTSYATDLESKWLYEKWDTDCPQPRRSRTRPPVSQQRKQVEDADGSEQPLKCRERVSQPRGNFPSFIAERMRRAATAIRECGLFLSDVAAEVREAAEHGTARRTQTPTDTAKTDTDWRDVQRRLMELYKRGDPYISIGNLAKRLGCAKATIQKAIKDSTKLKYWQARHTKAKGSEQ